MRAAIIVCGETSTKNTKTASSSSGITIKSKKKASGIDLSEKVPDVKKDSMDNTYNLSDISITCYDTKQNTKSVLMIPTVSLCPQMYYLRVKYQSGILLCKSYTSKFSFQCKNLYL